MEDKYYVYIYLDPRECPPAPIYIGRGKGKRINHGLWKRCHNEFLKKKVTKIRAQNLKPIICKLHENLSFQEASNLEKIYIFQYGRLNNNTGILCNFTDGGEDGTIGFKHSEETKKLMSEQRKNKKQTEAQYAANCSRLPASDKTKLKQSLANKGQKRMSDEQYKENGLKRRGTKMSEESRQKMSDVRKGVRTEKQKQDDVIKLAKLHYDRIEKEKTTRGNMSDEEWIEFKRKTYSKGGFYGWFKNFKAGKAI